MYVALTFESIECLDLCTKGYRSSYEKNVIDLVMRKNVYAVIPAYACSITNNCDQECVLLGGVDHCSCNSGYQLADDGLTCIGLYHNNFSHKPY